MMDDHPVISGGIAPVQQPEEHEDCSTTLGSRENGDQHEHHPEQGYESDSAKSRTDHSAQPGRISVKQVVDRFEAAAASGAFPTVTPTKKTRRKWSENSNTDVDNAQKALTKSLRAPQNGNRNVSGSMTSEHAVLPSSDAAAPADDGRSVLSSKSGSKWRVIQNGPCLGRAQSAKESFRSSATDEGSHHHHHHHHNVLIDSNGSSKSAVLLRAKSVGVAVETKLRAGKAAVVGLISELSCSSRNSSSVFPMPICELPDGDERRRDDSTKSSRAAPDILGPQGPSRTSSISAISPMTILTYTSSGGIEDLPRELSKTSGDESSEFAVGQEDQSPIEQVALVVPTTDDPSVPVWTFRTAVLGLFCCTLITFLNTYFSYRREPITISVTTVVIASAPLGSFMASTLPDKIVRIPWTPWRFSLNPGPFNMKEHALITIFASAGSVRPGGIFVVNIVKVFLGNHIGFLPGFIVILTCELLGYCWAVLLYKFLVEPARFWWPASLVNVSLIRALNLDEKRKGISLISFFLICFAVAFAYYVIPGFFIPSLTSVSVICLIFKHNVLAQQLGSGSRGLGLGAVSFDWATISCFQGSPLVVPWTAVVNIVVGFVIQGYLVAPLTFWKNWFDSKNYPIFSSDIFTKSGERYDFAKAMESRSHNQLGSGTQAYDELPHFSAFYTMSWGFTFALFGAVCSQVIFFHGRDLLRTFQSAIMRRSTDFQDVHTRLMSKYPKIPTKWCALLFLGTHLAAIVNIVVYKDQLEMKWWGIFLGDAFTAILVLPVSLLVATTNQLPNLGIIPQYIMGFIRQGEPVTNVMFRTYSAVVTGRTATYLGMFKFAHYMKIPPRASFYGQLIGTVVSALVSMLVTTWLTKTVDNICDITRLPSNTPWTCPQDRVFFDQVVSFGIAGPRRLLTNSDAPYRTLNYYFLPGFFVPMLLWLLTIAMPRRQWIRLINGPLIVRGAFLMPPSPIVNNTMWIYVALFFGVYVFHYKKAWWKRYNYVLSAALDAGTVVMALLLYYSLDQGKKSLHWWGRREQGDHCPLASCPTAPGVNRPGCPTF